MDEMELTPGQRIGLFAFDEPIPEAVRSEVRLVASEDLGELAWQEYEYTSRDGTPYVVFVEEGVVSHVDCHRRCSVNGRNLVGLSFKEAQKLVAEIGRAEGVEEMSEGPQSVYSLDSSGLQLWVRDGVIVTVQCSSP